MVLVFSDYVKVNFSNCSANTLGVARIIIDADAVQGRFYLTQKLSHLRYEIFAIYSTVYRIAGKFGGLVVLYITADLKFVKISYSHIIRMAIPYRTAKFKPASILAIAILGSTAKFNSRQYFRLYEMFSWRRLRLIWRSCARMLAWSDVAFSRHSARNTSVRKLQLSDKNSECFFKYTAALAHVLPMIL